jgi:hypothetical protein
MPKAALATLLLAAAASAAEVPEAAIAPPPPAPAETAPSSRPVVGLGSPAVNAPGGLAGAAAAPAHLFEVSGYAILSGSWVQQDPQFLFVGRNNGFSLGDARLEVTGRPLETVWLYLSFDGAVPLRSGDDPLQGRRAVDLKDAYGVWAPGYHFRLQAGQFKAPQDLEALLEETEIKFPTRSLVTDGIGPPQGYTASGLSLDRQIGIALGTDQIELPLRSSLVAQAAVMNGNGPNQLVNDTQYPTVAGRVALGLFGIASLGFDAYFSPRATGQRPNLFRDDYVGMGGDVRVEWLGLHAMLLLQRRTIHHVTSGAPDEIANGLSIEGSYRFFFIEPAMRYSRLDPSNIVPGLAVSESTAALNFYAGQAARLSLAYTFRNEQPGRQLQNDSFDLAAQVRF